jgi:xanthine dehydrogenase YagS FAD-binding subunit
VRPFVYQGAQNTAQAFAFGNGTGQGQVDAPVQYLAGGTTLIDLMKLDVLRPQRVVGLERLQGAFDRIEVKPDGLYLGAMTKMSSAADHPGVLKEYPAIAQSLQLAASAQLRNMATLGGNVLQKTRCTYYRDPSWEACNKRVPGSGCAAVTGFNRNHAVFGVDSSCISQYPGDFGVALIALEAQVDLIGARASRRISFADLHRPLDGQPHLENTLRTGEIIGGFFVPAGAWAKRSVYIKVRDRESYEFAIASAAVALDLDGDKVRQVRIGLGGMAYRPWRARNAEQLLMGQSLTEASAMAAAQTAMDGAVTHGHNDYKPELARRTLVRALLSAKAMTSTGLST